MSYDLWAKIVWQRKLFSTRYFGCTTMCIERSMQFSHMLASMHTLNECTIENRRINLFACFWQRGVCVCAVYVFVAYVYWSMTPLAIVLIIYYYIFHWALFVCGCATCVCVCARYQNYMDEISPNQATSWNNDAMDLLASVANNCLRMKIKQKQNAGPSP